MASGPEVTAGGRAQHLVLRLLVADLRHQCHHDFQVPVERRKVERQLPVLRSQ